MRRLASHPVRHIGCNASGLARATARAQPETPLDEAWICTLNPAQLLLIAATLFSVLGLLACTTAEPPSKARVGNGPTGTSGACATPSPGCGCSTPGESRTCGSTVSSDGGEVTCSDGTMVCGGGGIWGPCVGSGSHVRPLHPHNLSYDAGSCADPVRPVLRIVQRHRDRSRRRLRYRPPRARQRPYPRRQPGAPPDPLPRPHDHAGRRARSRSRPSTRGPSQPPSSTPTTPHPIASMGPRPRSGPSPPGQASRPLTRPGASPS